MIISLLGHTMFFEEKKTLVAKQQHACCLILTLPPPPPTHTHNFHPLSPLFFFLKATQEEINHEGKTQLHPLAAGHSSYFVWNWLSESRRPAWGAGT